jgi:hypothetical protein
MQEIELRMEQSPRVRVEGIEEVADFVSVSQW